MDLYFGLFQLILKGSLGRAADAERERQAKKLGPPQHSAPAAHLIGAKKKDRHRNRGLSPADLKKKAEQDRAKVGFFPLLKTQSTFLRYKPSRTGLEVTMLYTLNHKTGYLILYNL